MSTLPKRLTKHRLVSTALVRPDDIQIVDFTSEQASLPPDDGSALAAKDYGVSYAELPLDHIDPSGSASVIALCLHVASNPSADGADAGS